MSITVIHGPKASGKTRRAQQLLQHYGCHVLVDDWVAKDHRQVPDGALVLTYERPDIIHKYLPRATLVSIDAAKDAVS